MFHDPSYPASAQYDPSAPYNQSEDNLCDCQNNEVHEGYDQCSTCIDNFIFIKFHEFLSLIENEEMDEQEVLEKYHLLAAQYPEFLGDDHLEDLQFVTKKNNPK